jgi:hypothetical protein
MKEKSKGTGFAMNLTAGAVFTALAAVLFFFAVNSPSLNTSPDFNAETRAPVFAEEEPEPEEVKTYSAGDYEGIKLYYSPYGKKWHLTRECQYLRNSEDISFTDYETAVSMGLTPCSNCGYPGSVKD